MPQLQDEDFADVPGRGIVDRAFVCGLRFCFRCDRGRSQVGDLLGLAGRADDYGPSRAHSSGRGQFLWSGCGPAIQPFHQPVDGTALWIANRWFDFPPPQAALSFVDAILGAAVGSGLLWAVAEGYFRLRGREGMGLGDVKMMAAVGVFLGLKRTLMTVLAGSLLGSVIGIVLISLSKKDRNYELPFGTFLGAGALLVLFFGTPALQWYQSLLAVK